MGSQEMQKADGKVFSQLLKACGDVYGHVVTDAQVRIWWSAMRHMPIDKFTRALEQIVKTSKFMPKPSDILGIVNGTAEDLSLHGWIKVHEALQKYGIYHSVAFDDPIIPAVIQAMGGWRQLCLVTTRELPFKAKEFGQIYTIFSVSPPSYLPKYVVGLQELACERADQQYKRKAVKLIGNHAEAWNLLQQHDFAALPSPRVEPVDCEECDDQE